MKRIFLIAILALLQPVMLLAEEGMWLPLLLKQLNEKDMIAAGMKITADDIYNVNKSSLKDAIVQFGRGCTGELISNEGLLLTNHHCGYGQIQDHSSVENDYIQKGFWAANRGAELPNPGLTVTFIIRMEDVTAKIIGGLSEEMNENERENAVAAASLEIVKNATRGTHFEAFVRPMYNGNEYYLFVTEVFKDIRLVGAPPSAIGNYGKDTDNWTWPRHTADFSLFRIYAGPDNKPADYSPSNIPFKPRNYLKINIGGVKENDFTLVYGFPGRTNEYLTSYAVKHLVEKSNPLKVSLRAARLEVMKKYMDNDRRVFIQYADKYSGVSNYHKKWSGETKGLKKASVIERKQELETEFRKRVSENPDYGSYKNMLDDYERLYQKLNGIQPEVELYTESLLSVESIRFATNFKKIAALPEEEIDIEKLKTMIRELKQQAELHFKDYYPPLDREMLRAMVANYLQYSTRPVSPAHIPAFTADATDAIHTSSIFTDTVKFNSAINGDPRQFTELVKNDPLYRLAIFYADHYRDVIQPEFAALNNELIPLNRRYMNALRNVITEKKYYPDANSTMRVTYGKIEGYRPSETVTHTWYTTADEIVVKYETGNPDYEKDERLFELIRKKDFGPYATKEGNLHTCFAASNHTTGGNSGSPVLNAKGELIGTNFDRNWEGTMSDVYYDINQVRNIAMDARYMLFIIDKYAGAGHLIKEMKLVN